MIRQESLTQTYEISRPSSSFTSDGSLETTGSMISSGSCLIQTAQASPGDEIIRNNKLEVVSSHRMYVNSASMDEKDTVFISGSNQQFEITYIADFGNHFEVDLYKIG